MREVRNWLRHWGALWGIPELSATTRVEFSRRMTRALGRAFPERGLIRLRQDLRSAPRPLLEEVLCHEAAHVAAWRLYGDGIRLHGAEWAALVAAAGFPAQPTLAAPQGHAPAPARSRLPGRWYVHRCPHCGAARGARRRMQRWRCTACLARGRSGTLVVEETAGVSP